MPSNQKYSASAMEIDRLAVQLAKDPQSKVFLPLAEEYCKVGMWEEAAAVLEDGLRFYPGFITAMVVLGRAYDQLGQPTKAKAILEEAVKLSPENLRAHRTLIKIYMVQGLTQEALKSCDVILNLNPRDEEALSVQAKLGRPAKEPEKVASKPPATSRPSRPVDSVAGQIEKNDAADINDRLAVEEPSPIARAGTIMETVLEASGSRSPGSIPGADLSSETPSSGPASTTHADTIKQLESWLHSIQRERRDRRASGEPSSSTSQ
ncbi:MAG TPA: tetratricopeptide repeat protein [Nitrospira sp.]|nr:tetratricopeptide repeat protein [Nitrospira sp.]